MGDLMLKSVYAEQAGRPLPILVDLGYWSNQDGSPGPAIERYEAMLKTLPRRRFSFAGYGRVFAEIPPTKLKMIQEKFPIVEGSTYWRATHHWRGLAAGEEGHTGGHSGDGSPAGDKG